MKTIKCILFILIMANNLCFSQISASQRNLLLRFLKEKEERDEDIEQLTKYFYYTDVNQFDTIKQTGVFSFGLTISHTRTYLFTKLGDDINIISDELLEDKIIAVCSFLLENKMIITLDERRKYLKRVIEIEERNVKSSYLDLSY
ncbi:MAG: hypothetical protein PHW91_06875 [Bacteroidales bacterium]|nr:hypothetical protein [Bacteroidales bacterium]